SSQRSRDSRAPPSFPTRRSSDLRRQPEHAGKALHGPASSPHRRGETRKRPDCTKGAGSDHRDKAALLFVEIRNGVRSLRKVLYTDRKSTRLNSSHEKTSYAVFCP